MQTINGKLIIEPSEESKLLPQKLEEIITKAEALEITLNQQNNQLESLKLLITNLDKKIHQLETQKVSSIQEHLRLLNSRVNRKLLILTISSIVGFSILGIVLIQSQKTENKSDDHSTIELIKTITINS